MIVSRSNVFVFSLFAALSSTHSFAFYQTLLSGERFKGYMLVSALGDDQYLLSFDVKQSDGDAKWSLHMSSAPYDMAVITENCQRARKSPHLLRNMPLNDTAVSLSQIVGHTVVVSNKNGVVACASIILPGSPLLRASFHTPTIEGHIHIIPLQDKVRILPDLNYKSTVEGEELQKGVLEWAFLPKCVRRLQPDWKGRIGSEIGVYSRITVTVDVPSNFTFQSFVLLFDGKVMACSPIVSVEVRQLRSGRHLLSQAHFYEPVRTVADFEPDTLHIRDDCLDMATESVHRNFGIFYPTLHIFGPDTVALKSLVTDNSCGPLRPQFPRPASTANFMHPLSGRLVFVDMDDKILLTGEMRQLLDTTATRATVQVSRDFVNHECPECTNNHGCHTVEDAVIIVGSGEPMVTLNGVFPWFEIATMRSVIIDLHWTKVCTNLTHLASGALSAHALIKRISINSSPVVASIVVLEYPANNYTEALVNKHQIFSSATAHARPLEQSITNSVPCGEENLGPSEDRWWIDRLTRILASDENDTTVIIGSKQLVTGADSVLGTSVLLTDGHHVSCGHFEALTEKTIAVAKFTSKLSGYVKMTQYGASNWSTGIPTEVYYHIGSLGEINSTSESGLEWQFVDTGNNTCDEAPLFNPFAISEHLCAHGSNKLCLLGADPNKSQHMVLNRKQHIVVDNLPLSGPYSIMGSSLRVRLQDGGIECVPLRRFSEATFRWIAPSNYTLTDLQKLIARRLQVDIFQVQFDYTREHYQAHCNIYRVTILEEDWRLSEILDMFNAPEKRYSKATPRNLSEFFVEKKMSDAKSKEANAHHMFVADQ
ncbi:hypothetical protein Q1695_001696 [Nippostrongylus brasiliensis]|nr:hypothetical protein Q1695_001696 [Nippostrongylus brasiliensis]